MQLRGHICVQLRGHVCMQFKGHKKIAYMKGVGGDVHAGKGKGTCPYHKSVRSKKRRLCTAIVCRNQVVQKRRCKP